jgi:hypothetical protein
LHDNSYYSLITSANSESEVIFARTGANDRDFNLRSEPAFIFRQSGANHVFASVLETHGYFNESIEASVGARGLVESVTVVGTNDVATVVELNTTTGNSYNFAICNLDEAQQDATHSVEFEGRTFTWNGAFAQV